MVDAPAMPRQRPVPESPVSPEEVAGVRRPTAASICAAAPDVPRSGRLRLRAGGLVRRRLGQRRPRGRCAGAGQYFLAPVAGENLIIVRGNDGELRGFYNVCRHRGATIVEEESGTLPRFQCPYHAWVYDLEGTLKQPRHTELLDDFDPAEWGLIPVRVDTWQGIVYVDLSGTAEPLHDFLGDIVTRVRAVRSGRAAAGAAHRLRRQGELEGDRRELPGVLPLPRRPSAAEPDHAVQLGELPAVKWRGDEQLHGGPAAVRDAVDDRRGGRPGRRCRG